MQTGRHLSRSCFQQFSYMINNPQQALLNLLGHIGTCYDR